MASAAPNIANHTWTLALDHELLGQCVSGFFQFESSSAQIAVLSQKEKEEVLRSNHLYGNDALIGGYYEFFDQAQPDTLSG